MNALLSLRRRYWHSPKLPAILLLLVSQLFAVFSQPANWDITYFSTEDGLSSNHVNYVTKDSRGFIWVGTETGLNKFDGYSFTSLKLPSGADHPLSNVKILIIFEDKDSILWIGTSDGLYRYKPSEPIANIRHYRFIDKPDSITYRFSQPVYDICEDKNGLFWIISMDNDDAFGYELHTFNKRTETFGPVFIDSSFFDYGKEKADFFGILESVFSDKNGDLWFGSNKGLLKYDFENKSFQTFKYAPETIDLNNVVMIIQEDSQGNLWTGSMNGLRSFDREKSTFGKPVALDVKNWFSWSNHSMVYALKEDQKGYFWARPNANLARFTIEKGGRIDLGSLEIWETDYTTIEVNPMRSLMVENPWLVWLGVSDRGLCRVNLHRNEFKTIPSGSLNRSGVIELDYVHALSIDKNDQLWISRSTSGAIQYNLLDHQVNFHNAVPAEFIHGIDKDQYGNRWFASRYGSASRAIPGINGTLQFHLYFPDQMNPASITERTETYAKDKIAVSPHMFEHLLFKDRDGILWFNSGRGIHDRYDPAIDGFIHLDHRVADYFNNDTCTEAEIDGEIWFPTAEGLLRLLPPFIETAPYTIKASTSILYRNDPAELNSLNSSWIRTILFSEIHEPGTLWIGTIGGGLVKLLRLPVPGSNQVKVHFKPYTVSDGLCDNNVLGILEDKNGYLWLSTLNGLSRFDPRTGIFNNFYAADGLPTNHFSWANPCISSTGEIFFATEAGIVNFHPDSIKINTTVPPIVITEFRIFNETVHPGEHSPLEKSISFTRSIELNYKQNFLSFEFAALNYEQPERNLYNYKLEGFDKEWIHAGTRRYVEYKGLKPGGYTFRVQGSNNSGLWNHEGTSLDILIHHPPWQTWWSYVIYSLLIAGLIVWYRQFLIHRERMKTAVEVERVEKEKAKAIDSFRSRFFTNISHEFRTPLTLVAGPLEDSLKSPGEVVPMNKKILRLMLRNARRLQRLINQLLDIARIESGSMHLQLTRGKLPAFVRTIASSFLSLAESDHIEYQISVPEVQGGFCFDADKLEKIIANLLSNAFKFTPEGGKVSLELICLSPEGSDKPRRALLRVSDNGKGIDNEHLDRIFDRFYQVTDNDTREVEGSGIGLALTRELVELIHGEIEVESQPGKGTSFSVNFPVSEDCFSEQEIADMEKRKGVNEEWMESEAGVETKVETEVRGKKENEERPGARSTEENRHEQEKELVLVVEDNADLRMYISQQLRGNYRVVDATNGREGLEKAIELIPDLVVTDIMMPVMDGMEMCRRMKAQPATNHIPVIMLTAKADKESKLTGLEAAADDYIVKPFDSDLLLARAKNLVNQRKELRRHFEKKFLMEANHKTSLSPEFQMLREVLRVFDQHLSDPDFTIVLLGKELKMSRSQLFRKIHSITGSSPNELLRLVRMKHAARLLRSGAKNITQVMYEVGMQSPSYFASSFRKYFGVNPKEFGKKG